MLGAERMAAKRGGLRALRTALFYFLLVNCDAGIGADDGARGATNAHIRHVATESVAAMIDFARCEGEGVSGAGHDAEVATLAAIFIYDDSSFYLTHFFVLFLRPIKGIVHTCACVAGRVPNSGDASCPQLRVVEVFAVEAVNARHKATRFGGRALRV